MFKVGFGLSLLAAILLAICGCGDTVNPQVQTVKLDESFEITQEQTVEVEGEDLQLTFYTVVEDMRCRPFEFCEWPGFVSISLIVSGLQLPSPTVKMILFVDSDSVTKDVCSVDTGDFNIRFEGFEWYGYYSGKAASAQTSPERPKPTATLKISKNFVRPDYDGNVTIGEYSPGLMDVDPFDLNSVRIVADTLLVEITSSGGCARHYDFLFMTPPTFTLSNPPQADLYIRHFSDGDPCDGLITRVVKFDISAIRRLYESIYGRRDPVQLNVFDYFVQTPGQSKSVLYEPEPMLLPAAVGNRWIYQSVLSNVWDPDGDTLWPYVTQIDTISIVGTEMIDGKSWWKLSGDRARSILGFDRFRYQGDTVVSYEQCGESISTTLEFVPLWSESCHFNTPICSRFEEYYAERRADSLAYIWCRSCSDAGFTRLVIPGIGVVAGSSIAWTGGGSWRLLEYSLQR